MALHTMPTDTIFAVSAIVAVFCIFGGVLAWSERQTSFVPSDKRRSQDATKTQQHVDIVKALVSSADSNDTTITTNERSPDKNAA